MAKRLTKREKYMGIGVMNTLKLNGATKEEIVNILNYLLKRIG